MRMKYTNEELVRLIQSGQREYIPQLWEQIGDFVKYMADKHLLHYPQSCQQFCGDMVNQAYFDFLKAIDGYKEGKGKFTSYLSFHLRNAFNEVLQGRTQKAQNEPLNSAVSLDTPIEDTEDLTLADMIIDTQAEAYYGRIEDQDFWQSVNEVVRQAIEKAIPEDLQDLFFIMLERGTSVADSLRIMGIEDKKDHRKYYERYRGGLRKLRKQLCIYLGKEKNRNTALDDYMYYQTGFNTWRRQRFTSSVEMAVMKRNDPAMTAGAVSEVIQVVG